MSQLLVKRSLNIRGKIIEFKKPKVMGILNMTPDSFYDGGKFNSFEEAKKRVDLMIKEGADIVDIGGCSTRPGSESISAKEEWIRIKDIINYSIKMYPSILFSVDTFRSEVAEKSLDIGIDFINDISGGTIDSNMLNIVSKYKVPYVLMHIKGTPKDMMMKTNYNHLINDIITYFQKKILLLNDHDINDIILDPGFGFAKDYDQNYEILYNLNILNIFNMPILVGLSRKSFVKKKYGIDNSMKGTLILNQDAINKGADIIRVHDVKEHVKLVSKLY
mgnify:CR=1 FL=1